MSRQVVVHSDLDTLSKDAAERLLAIALSAIALRGRFSIALAGGSTPKRLYSLLASDYQAALDWSKVHIFFGDERTVPPDNPDSNYHMAHEALLSKVAIPAENIHRMRGEADPAEAAAEYAGILRDQFGGEGLPEFDIILLGMGPDGHTLSLFPHTSALHVTDQLVVANRVDKLNTTRITFTYPVANNAKNIFFQVAGADKAAALHEVLEGAPNSEEYPSQGIQLTHGDVLWFLDTAAAAQLKNTPTTPGIVSSEPYHVHGNGQ